MSSKYRDFRPIPAPRAARLSDACLPWSTLLPDAAEGLLTEIEERALKAHLVSCSSCSEELAEAQRGLAWLNVLKEQAPEPPPSLLSSVLAQTTGYNEVGVLLPELPPFLSPADLPFAAETEPVWESTGQRALRWLRGDPGTWSSLLQPRLAMTGAMAFFSICLTLNLLGFSLSQRDLQNTRRDSLERTVGDTGATLLRSLHGLRVAYRVESRVNQMRAQQDEPETLERSH